MAFAPQFNLAVEGLLDADVAARLLAEHGAVPNKVYGQRGKPHLLERLPQYATAAEFSPWMAIVDLDDDHECPGAQVSAVFPHGQNRMCFRVAVPSIESWLMADREAFATFLAVRVADLPEDVEAVGSAKAAVVNAARRSRRSAVREALVPRERSGRSTGPEYNAYMRVYVNDHWRPSVAADRCNSLARSIARIAESVAFWTP